MFQHVTRATIRGHPHMVRRSLAFDATARTRLADSYRQQNEAAVHHSSPERLFLNRALDALERVDLLLEGQFQTFTLTTWSLCILAREARTKGYVHLGNVLMQLAGCLLLGTGAGVPQLSKLVTYSKSDVEAAAVARHRSPSHGTDIDDAGVRHQLALVTEVLFDLQLSSARRARVPSRP